MRTDPSCRFAFCGWGAEGQGGDKTSLTIDAAAARVTKAGGKMCNGPLEVPGGQWIVQCLDAQGAMVAPRR